MPGKILLEFSNEGYKELDITRIGIYKSALELIKENPFFGIGSGSFSEIFYSNTNFLLLIASVPRRIALLPSDLTWEVKIVDFE